MRSTFEFVAVFINSAGQSLLVHSTLYFHAFFCISAILSLIVRSFFYVRDSCGPP